MASVCCRLGLGEGGKGAVNSRDAKKFFTNLVSFRERRRRGAARGDAGEAYRPMLEVSVAKDGRLKNAVKTVRRGPLRVAPVAAASAPLEVGVPQLLDALPQQIAVIDRAGVIRYVNRAWRKYGKGGGGCLRGRGAGDNYLHVCERSVAAGCAEGEDFAAAIRAVLQGELDEFSLEYFCPAGAGQHWFIGHVSRFEGGGAVISHEEVTRLKQAEADANRLAHFDPLTGLPNRLLMSDRLAQALAQAEREAWQLAVLFLDLDRFKVINDNLGHAAGDQLLKGVTERLRGCVRRSDTVARLGGDEFVVVLVPVRQPRDISRIARKILAALTAPFVLGGEEVYTSASIGVAIFPGDGTDAGVLLHNADLAMYRAKERGRNVFQYFTAEMNLQAVRRLGIETALRRALSSGGLVLHFQEQIDLASGRVCAVEALLRVRNGGRGLLQPRDFLEVAEETGLIVPIGQWVMRLASRRLRSWQKLYGEPLRLAINLSPREFRSPKLVPDLARCLAVNRLDPAQIEIEITEKLLVKDSPEDRERLHRLKELGVSIAIDDFGTGFSSIHRLKQLPIDRLKITHTVVQAVPTDKDARVIIHTIVDVAHNLGLKVVAEGVNTPEQHELLRQLGCDTIQGWHCILPVPEKELLALLGKLAVKAG
ncbi:MAG TPA: two-component system response regulator [Desulfuromonas sp.]|nr:two-component system response regulator [Desulfuromonas sp.]